MNQLPKLMLILLWHVSRRCYHTMYCLKGFHSPAMCIVILWPLLLNLSGREHRHLELQACMYTLPKSIINHPPPNKHLLGGGWSWTLAKFTKVTPDACGREPTVSTEELYGVSHYDIQLLSTLCSRLSNLPHCGIWLDERRVTSLCNVWKQGQPSLVKVSSLRW
jgi:hypothetical protein